MRCRPGAIERPEAVPPESSRGPSKAKSQARNRWLSVTAVAGAGALLLAGSALGLVGRGGGARAQSPCPPTPTPKPGGILSPVPTDQICYPPGWNLVGGPVTYPVPLWIWDPTTSQYQMLPAGSRLPAGPGPGESNGQGAWAYFAQTTGVTFPGVSSSIPVSVGLAAGRWQQVGAPFSLANAAICGSGFSAFAYDPAVGAYSQTTSLKQGEGAWIYAPAGGAITLVEGNVCPSS